MSKLTKHQLFLLLEKQQLGTCTPEEEEMLNNWFDQAPVIEELTFISPEEKEQIGSEISAAIMQKIAAPAPERSKTIHLRKLWPVSFAAAIMVGILFYTVYYFSGNPVTDQQITITAPGGIRKMPVMLPDSSEVWLSGGSSIRYAKVFSKGERHVTLTGTAGFSVRRDVNAPFTVSTDQDISVKVLGTSFVVDTRNETKHINITVLTGMVQIDQDTKTLGTLVPGERLNYSYDDRTFTRENYLPEEMEEWKNNNTIFLDGISLSELAVLLQDMYKINVTFDLRQAERYRFKMSFSRSLAVDEVLGMMSTMSGLKFERKGQYLNITE